MRVIFVLFTLTFFTSFLFGQCTQTTNISSTIVTQSCPSGTVTYQVSFSSSIPNGNNSLCYGYTITNPDGSQQTTNIGPVNQSNTTNKNWTHMFNVTINCTQGLTLFINAWSNQNCGGNMCNATISKVLVLAALPVDILYFKANPSNEGNFLEWATANETNNAGFYIEHSTNATDWETIEFIEGNGTTPNTSSYRFFHPVKTTGQHVYRLLQTDYDGTSKYSHLVYCSKESPSLTVFSNLIESSLVITSAEAQNIRITDSMGNLVSSHSLDQGTIDIPLHDVLPGLYFIHTKNQQVYKFIKY